MRPLAAGALLLVLSATGAAAQPAPQRTSATYEDWTVQCELNAGPPAQKLCEVMQVGQAQGQTVSRVAIGRVTKTEPFKIVVQLPVNLWLPAGVKIQLDDKDPGLAAPFRRCVPAGCFADIEIKDDMVNAGGQWSDTEVVVDGNLITSRKPDDLPAFCREIVRALAKTG